MEFVFGLNIDLKMGDLIDTLTHTQLILVIDSNFFPAVCLCDR